MRVLGSEESIKIAAKYKLPLISSHLAKTEKQAITLATKAGYPVAIKIASPSISHKTEAGGVLLNVKNEKDVSKGFSQLIDRAKKFDKKAKIDGVIIQPMTTGLEFLVGSKRDPQFGNTIVLGVGGTLVEVVRDVSMRIVPITENDAHSMINELRSQNYLNAFRGQKAVDRNTLAHFLVQVSKMLETEKPVELDLNPIMVSGSDIKIVDVRIVK